MKVTDIVERSLVVPALSGRTRPEVIAEFADRISSVKGIDRQQIYQVLDARERLGSTGIGESVAFPHATLPAVNRVVALVGRSKAGVAFDAIDGKPVQLFLVVLSPNQPANLQAMARMSRLMRSPELRLKLIQADDAETMFNLIEEADNAAP